MKLKTLMILLLLSSFTITLITIMSILAYNRLHLKGLSGNYKSEYDEFTENEVSYKFQKNSVDDIKNITKIIDLINNFQVIFNHDNVTCLDCKTTIIVVQVHRNISYLNVFLESVCKIWKINESLLIFAHDYYDDQINSVIRTIQCAKVMQIFYPYSVQLHPNTYPGEDSRFCQELDQCVDSKKRDPVLVQAKLFWWWLTSRVFDYVTVLKKYDGYIYFLETEMYLTSDFVHIAKTLERGQPKFCPDCKILSLGAGSPRPEMYHPERCNLIVKVWGWSNYSNSGIGFNRTTWNEIKGLKNLFCYFKDSSWEYSLKYLASKTRKRRLYMLSTEGPRFFPTTGCGAFRNGTDCDLTSNYHDILRFIPKIEHAKLAHNFKLKFDIVKSNVVEARGAWEDARDIDLCMCFPSKNTTSDTCRQPVTL